MTENKKKNNKKPKYITIRGVKVGVQNLCIMISTILMTVSILVFGIIYLSRDNAEAGQQHTTKGENSIHTGSTNSTGETSTDETITIETGTEAEETTEEVETLEFDADDDESSAGKSPLTIKVNAASTWVGKKGKIVVQYKVTLKNNTNKTVNNWGLAFHYNSDFELLDRWNGVMEDIENNVKITPISSNKVIKAGEKYEIGFIVETDGYIYPQSVTIILDDFSKTINLSFKRPEPTTTPGNTTTEITTTVNGEETTTFEEETTTLDTETTEPSGEDTSSTVEDETTTPSDTETSTTVENSTTAGNNESETTTVAVN